MNVQASESMNEAWVSLQGLVINGAFPLQRFLNGSEHTGVFLAESRRHKLPQVAIKLVRAVPARADAQLSRWLTADSLVHPHLIRIYEAGRCQLGGLQYLYAVMEYADQNLAELLDHRALTEDEAREMLVPTLSALAFLHERKYVQGQLKPSNILVVGEQLKLASDTIRRAGESMDADKVMTVYDPPEARGGSYWPAGDVWALGVALCEALTRNRPVGLHDGNRPVAFPRDFPTAFREVVARCLSRRPHDRPSIAEVDAWLRGKDAPAAQAAAAPAAREAPTAKTVTPEVAAPKTATPDATPSKPAVVAQPATSKATERNVSESALKDVARNAPESAQKGAARTAPESAPRDAARSAPELAPKDVRHTQELAPKDVAREAQSATLKAGTIEVSEVPLGPPPAREAPAPAARAPAVPSQPTTKSSQPPVMTATASQRGAKPPSRRRTVVVTLAAAAALVLIWAGARMLRTHQATPMPPAADVIDDVGTAVSTPQTSSETMPAAPTEQPTLPASAGFGTNTAETPSEPEAEATVAGTHEVLPDVPHRARQTIRGHVKVSVRVIVDPDGSVFAALVDDGGPSRYFSRLAIDAAKKWTFEPVAADGQRFIQLRFDFTRDGTTARAVPLK